MRSKTPWQKVFRKIGLSQSSLAKEMGCHRSKISVALKGDDGLVNARDQVSLMKIATKHGVKLTLADFVDVA
ncbi:hypothetical protein [Breoghania sp.]|uniref:hypothetical protein n=1 Tax=Breoghania sp. TaxID=2065378 RepID=UPI002AA7F228|nr:hypothetical protein [Breoghania sp.]